MTSYLEDPFGGFLPNAMYQKSFEKFQHIPKFLLISAKAMRSIKRYVSSAKTAELHGIPLTEKSVINVRIPLH